MIFSPAVRLVCCLAVLCTASLGYPSPQQDSSLSTSGLRASASVPPSAMPHPNISPELRGDIYMARKMYREAVDMYRQGSPDSPILANKIGIAFHQLMLLNLAKKNYERAVKLDPKYAEAINNLGTVYYAEKSYRRSIGYYKKALRCSHPTASIYANMGAAYFARKNYKMASEYYEQALKLDPEVFEHHGNFGTLMQERTVEERAMFHLYLAKTYAKSGANDRALIYLRKALEEGVKDRNKIPDMPEFSTLKKNADFQELLAQNPKPL
jgi:tetratricopeptide (TPR) repeat protein